MRINTQNPVFFAVLAAVFFLPFLGGVHLFDWDEINFAEIAREMVVLGNYLEIYMNYELFTEKPPLFFWLQATSMNVLGIGDYAARLPNALMGIIALPVLFVIGKAVQNARFGFYWALAYFGSILPHLYFKSGIIDPVFNFFIFMGLWYLIRYTRKYKYGKYSKGGKRKIIPLLLFAGLFTGLATLTKGPVAYLITCLTLLVYWISVRFKWFIAIHHFLLYTAAMLFTKSIWVVLNSLQHGPTFMVEFTIRQWELLTTQDAGHGGFMGYHFVVLLVGCFPASIFAIQAMVNRDHRANRKQREMRRWMIYLFWVVLILFTLVSTKIVHYSSLAYYPLTYLAALSLLRLEQGIWRATGFMKFGLWFIGGLAAGITIALPFLGMQIDKLKPLFEKDPFAVENLQAQVSWSGFESISGILLALILVFSLVIFRRNLKLRFAVLFYGTGVWVMLTLIFYIGRIESYSQRAAIEFWEERQGKDVYVHTYGYKSYAHIYYSRTQPMEGAHQADGNWLLHGEIDKPVYISCKVTSKERLEEEVPDAQFLYAKNGFYFYKRIPSH
jgi:4-amino-4-deoxy-L-arabinose transferase-like glycosyltransferase